jgi:hypothetical protein
MHYARLDLNSWSEPTLPTTVFDGSFVSSTGNENLWSFSSLGDARIDIPSCGDMKAVIETLPPIQMNEGDPSLFKFSTAGTSSVFNSSSLLFGSCGTIRSFGDKVIPSEPQTRDATNWNQIYYADLEPLRNLSTTETATKGKASDSNKKPSVVMPARTIKHQIRQSPNSAQSKRTKSTLQENKEYIREMEPTGLDVLGGRGAGANYHKGNERYWKEVLELRPAYKACGEDNNKKNRIVLSVIDCIEKSNGRFLGREKETKRLYVLLEKKKTDKVRQALRDEYIPLFARE